MPKSKILILIDGHALAFRQYYALERTRMKTKEGLPTWAVFGFFKAIFDLLRNKHLSADALGVAFDVSHHTFRTEKFEDYKANRTAMPDEMQIQMELIYEGLRAFNIPIYTKEGFEADDVIGTISKRACELGHKVFILTGDQDSFQLVDKNGCIKVIIPTNGKLKEYDWEEVHKKLNIYPNQVIDYKALRGDVSDNIPGVKGIGEKTAAKLLEQFKSVDNVLAHIDEIEGNSIREKIKAGVEQAKLSKYLATIIQDVDIEFDFEKTKVDIPDIGIVTEFLRKMQFYSFLKNIENIMKLFNKEENHFNLSQTQTILPASNNGQLGLFAQAATAEVNKNIYNFEIIDNINELQNQTLISLKIFAKVKNAINFDVYGIALGYNTSLIYNNYITETNNENKTKIFYSNDIKSLKSILENENIKKITHDTKENLNILHSFGINLRGVVFDTMLASYIKDSSANNAFDVQCIECIDHALPTIVSEGNFSDYSAETAKDYVADFVCSQFELTKYHLKNLNPKEVHLLNEIEIPLAFVLSKMELNGVSVDVNYLQQLTNEFNQTLENIEGRIFDIAGETFNLNSPKQIGEILFKKLKIESPKKRGKTKNSTSAEVLTYLAYDHEIAQLILDYRQYSKLKSTYTDTLPLLIASDKRIHTSFNQTATTTGRLSSSNPNLQNIPIRTAAGNQIRQAFVPRDKQNYLILSADYSQIELRIFAHVTKDKNLIQAFKSGIDVHTLIASKVFDVPVEEVTKEMRTKAKAVNFGIVYGQTKYGLAKALKITPQQAEIFINKYFETYPNIKIYMENTIKFVEEEGYVETINGRRRYLNEQINSSNAMIREAGKRAAINHPIQGSASDLIKMAMIRFADKLQGLKSRLILQVHDELVVEVKKSELEIVKKLIKEAMELDQPLLVPLEIDINTGESWKE